MSRARTIADFGDGIATADIGDGQVTAGKLNSTLDLTGKTVTLPSGVGGKVLQMQHVYHTSTNQLTSSGAMHELSTSLRIAFTPQLSTSKLLFDVSAPFCSPNSTNLYNAQIYDVTNSAVVNQPPANASRSRVHWAVRVTNFDSNDMHMMRFSVVADASNTTARTYTIYHRTEGTTVQFLQSTLNSAAGFSAPIVFTILEIAQ